ncbi:MAG TPA: Hpt domain-containing protein, partial [Roseiflexaceae bacterium]|nr:Hpt domain-containing protein [Roseiflexaceae bacterium]
MDLTTFHGQFRDESIENLRVVGAGLLALESPDLSDEERRQLIDSVFRAMHTIKGSARMLGFE